MISCGSGYDFRKVSVSFPIFPMFVPVPVPDPDNIYHSLLKTTNLYKTMPFQC
jgi:hypothetical protein